MFGCWFLDGRFSLVEVELELSTHFHALRKAKRNGEEEKHMLLLE